MTCCTGHAPTGCAHHKLLFPVTISSTRRNVIVRQDGNKLRHDLPRRPHPRSTAPVSLSGVGVSTEAFCASFDDGTELEDRKQARWPGSSQ